MRIPPCFLVGAALALLGSPALAVDFTTKLTQLDGSPFVDASGKSESTQTTLAAIAVNALLASYPDEQNPPLAPDVKVRRFTLAEKIQLHPTDAQLTVDEIKMVKDLIGKGYSTLIVGESWRLLDPASVPVAPK